MGSVGDCHCKHSGQGLGSEPDWEKSEEVEGEACAKSLKV
jgi:hypothetical protein